MPPIFQSQRYTIACQSCSNACAMALATHVPCHMRWYSKPGVHFLQHRLRSCVCVCVCVCSCVWSTRARTAHATADPLTHHVCVRTKKNSNKETCFARLEYCNYSRHVCIYSRHSFHRRLRCAFTSFEPPFAFPPPLLLAAGCFVSIIFWSAGDGPKGISNVAKAFADVSLCRFT